MENKSNENLVNIPAENIEINFLINGQEYVVLKNNDEQDNAVIIAKIVSIDDKYDTIMEVTEEEYKVAYEEYISILENSLKEE